MRLTRSTQEGRERMEDTEKGRIGIGNEYRKTQKEVFHNGAIEQNSRASSDLKAGELG